MRKVLILALLLPFLSFSQDIIGTWVKSNETEVTIQFQVNGNLELIDLKHPENKVLKNITIKYKTFVEENISYLETEIFNQNKLIETKKVKYHLKNGKLYMPHFLEDNNAETTIDYKHEYVKITK